MSKVRAVEVSRVTLILCALAISWIAGLPMKARAATGLTVTNNATVSTAGWTNPNNANGGDNNTFATAAPGNNATITGTWTTYGFDSNLPFNAKVTKVEIIPQYKVGSTLSTATLGVHAVVSGTNCPVTAINDTSEPTAANGTDFIADVTSCRAWTRSDLLNGTFSARIDATRSGLLGVTFSLDYVRVRVTYSMPDYDLSAYRWFDNANSNVVGLPLAAQNTGPTLYAPRDRVRLRMLVHVTTTALQEDGEIFHLQIAQKTAACSTLTYSDVSGSTAFAPFDNPAVVDGSVVTTNANDPAHGSDTKISERYHESYQASTLSAVAVGQDGLWDFSLVGTAGPPNTTYCFRMVTESTAFTTYTTYPEITTSSAGSLNTDIVDASGVSVGSPSFGFSSLIAPIDCGSTTATFGTASQKIRAKNTTDTPTWSLSIAATSGATTLWNDGTHTYDFNDTGGSPNGCTDSGDTDTKAGLMSIDPSTGSLATRPTCTTTGISKGSASAFNEGTINAINLLTSSSLTDFWCYWDFTGVAMTQQIPGGQLPGSYSIGMTLTIVAF